MASSIDYRLYRAGDAAAISELYAAAFGQPQSAALWRWHFEENPCGPSHIVIAEEGGRCIGHYAVSPMPMSDRGTDFVAWIGIDHMVAPGFQGRGVYGGMEKYARATLPEVRPSYAFPNELSFPVFTGKFGWSSLGSVRTSIRPGRLAGLRRRFRPAACLVPAATLADVFLGRPRGRYEVAEIECFGPEFDDLWERSKESLGVSVRRRSQFLNWRFVQSPEHYRRFALRSGGALVGYVVMKVEARFGFSIAWVMDVLVRPEEGEGGLSEALRVAHSQVWSECDFSAILEPHPALARALWRGGYLKLPQWLLPHKFWFVVKRENHPDDRISRLDGWYLTWGVNDVP